MEKENKTKEIKITVCGNSVDVATDSINYHGLKIAVLGLLAFVHKHGVEVKEAIEQELGRKYKGNFKENFANMLHDWVDKVCREDYEPRQDN